MEFWVTPKLPVCGMFRLQLTDRPRARLRHLCHDHGCTHVLAAGSYSSTANGSRNKRCISACVCITCPCSERTLDDSGLRKCRNNGDIDAGRLQDRRLAAIKPDVALQKPASASRLPGTTGSVAWLPVAAVPRFPGKPLHPHGQVQRVWRVKFWWLLSSRDLYFAIAKKHEKTQPYWQCLSSSNEKSLKHSNFTGVL